MTTDLPILLQRLADTIAGAEPERQECQRRALAQAQRIAARLPLVHRTGREGGRPWRWLFQQGRLIAGEPHTEIEKQLGARQALYLFLGYGAYPHGNVAVLLAPTHVSRQGGGAFSPFDSGGLVKPGTCRYDGAPCETLAPSVQRQLLTDHSGQAEALGGFIAPYLAAHFRDPSDYLRRGQRDSMDYPAYHRVESCDGDRRAWTLEVRAAGDVEMPTDEQVLRAIVLSEPKHLLALPPPYRRFAVVARDGEDLARAISHEVLRLLAQEDAR